MKEEGREGGREGEREEEREGGREEEREGGAGCSINCSRQRVSLSLGEVGAMIPTSTCAGLKGGSPFILGGRNGGREGGREGGKKGGREGGRECCPHLVQLSR